MAKIDEIHKMNKILIKRYKLKVRDKLRLIKNTFNFEKGTEFTIDSIHSLYGWILLEESEQFPQEVKKLLRFMKK